MTTLDQVAALKNRVPVFGPFTWDNPAPGIWEATAKPHTTDGPAPFEAVATHDPLIGSNRWRWELYQPLDEPEHGGGLARIASGEAPTLADAQRQADEQARYWRDTEQHPLDVVPS